MMAAFNSYRALPTFDIIGDSWTVSKRWKSWIEEFECFADSQQHLLIDGEGFCVAHTASLKFHLGQEAREILSSLETGEPKEYKKHKEALE